MPPIEQQWVPGTPERAVADYFAAFRRRDIARLAVGATPASIRALAARVGPGLDASDSQAPVGSTGELTDAQAASTLGRIVTSVPKVFTDSVRCLILGQVLESRVFDWNPDGQGLIWLHCRVTGAPDEWVSVDSDRQIQGEIANHDAGVAHVVFRVAHEFPGQGIVPFPWHPQIATTQLVGGEWKLILDEESVVVPGFRGVGLWIDPSSAPEGKTDD